MAFDSSPSDNSHCCYLCWQPGSVLLSHCSGCCCESSPRTCCSPRRVHARFSFLPDTPDPLETAPVVLCSPQSQGHLCPCYWAVTATPGVPRHLKEEKGGCRIWGCRGARSSAPPAPFLLLALQPRAGFAGLITACIEHPKYI